ncbi:MAG: hypothetical protein A3I06_07780 [Candidatus Lindowbacteria bacterium RIFCSPLOWO2_02_FULL_62_12]|nr:MAG: hypothetical protein A3I06_07780 [Candidatus Lindowbacteria bacterium RIFCSPLOWO2_02_FULL_62_12]
MDPYSAHGRRRRRFGVAGENGKIRVTPLRWQLWIAILLAAGLSFQSARRLSKSLPERLPMVVALPDDTSAAIRPEIETRLVAAGVMFEFVPKDAGVARWQQSLFEGAPPLDTAVWGDLAGNPLPDVYIVRAHTPALYEQLAGDLREAFPAARVQYDAVALRRLAVALKAVRILVPAVCLWMLVLCCLSLADRMQVDRFHRLSEALRPAILSVLIAVIWMGCLTTALGYAAERRPAWGLRPFVDLAKQFFQAAGLDGWFAVKFFAGWLALVTLAFFLSGRRAKDAA